MKTTKSITHTLMVFFSIIGILFSAPLLSQDKSREVDVVYSKMLSALPEGSTLMAYPYADRLTSYGDKAKSTLNDKSDAIGGKAFEISTVRMRNPWDIGVTTPLIQDVKKGDVLHFTFFAKALSLPEGKDTAMMKSVGIQQSSAPYNSLFANNVYLNEKWQSFTFAGKADKNYKAGELQANFQLATGEQKIAFGPLLVFNVGNDISISSLPYVK